MFVKNEIFILSFLQICVLFCMLFQWSSSICIEKLQGDRKKNWFKWLKVSFEQIAIGST